MATAIIPSPALITAPPRHEVVAAYRATFARRVAEGSIRRLVIPHDLYGFVLLVVYLCISHTNRPRLYAARWPVFGVIVAWELSVLRGVSSANMATAFATGLAATWCIFWSAVWLIWYRPQFDAKRVERRQLQSDNNNEAPSK